MAEILAATSAVAGLLSLTITTIDISNRYFTSVKNAPKRVKAFFEELQLLKNVLLEFKKLEDDDDTAEHAASLDLSLSDACQKELEGLCKRLEKQSHGNPVSRSLRRLTWPFSEDEMSRTVDSLNRYQSSLHRILSAGNFKLDARVLSEVKSIREAQDQLATKVSYVWLSSASPDSNHESARAKYSQGTGQWFLESPAFISWMNRSRHSLWVHAIPGAGKTILCSTIIDHVLKDRQLNEGIAYFYFDFSDSSKQKLDACLRSILAQLCSAHPSMPPAVADLKTLSESPGRNGFLANDELLSTLVCVCSDLDRCRIVIDALDEGTDREELMKVIKALVDSTSVSLLATSRKDEDIIEDMLSDVMSISVNLDSVNVDNDIRAYVVKCFETDSKLRKRPQSAKNRIEEVLTTKAEGM